MSAQIATRRTYTPPKTYTFAQLEELWILAGGRKIAAPTAAAIALAESRGNPLAINHNSNGSIDRGLWQINSVHGALSTTDVAANARAAVKVYNDAGGSWAPWSTFKSGAYKAYANRPGIAIESQGAEGEGIFSIASEFSTAALEAFGFGAAVNTATKVVGTPTAASQAGHAIAKGEEAGEHALEALGPPSWVKLLITGVLLLAGAAMMIYGIMVAVGKSPSRIPIPVPV